MILSFTAINQQAEFRNFFCELAEIETALDFLSTITAQGDTIIKAHVRDKSYSIELPPEAFDGQPFAQPLRQLEEQWQAILREPLPVRTTLSGNRWRIDIICQRLRIYDRKIAEFNRVIQQLKLLRQRIECKTWSESREKKLIRHYDKLLTLYQQYLDREQAGQLAARKKLNQLECCQERS